MTAGVKWLPRRAVTVIFILFLSVGIDSAKAQFQKQLPPRKDSLPLACDSVVNNQYQFPEPRLQNSGQHDSDVVISMRCSSSLSVSSGNEPLLIIDGKPVLLSSLGDLPPNKIKTQQVLKPPASAAVYGSEGAFGVIVITTFFTKKERKKFFEEHEKEEPNKMLIRK